MGAAADLPVLAEELATYEARREELIGAARGKYVLIKGSQVIGTFESEADAINQGYRQLGNVPFLVKWIQDVELPLQFMTNVIAF